MDVDALFVDAGTQHKLDALSVEGSQEEHNSSKPAGKIPIIFCKTEIDERTGTDLAKQLQVRQLNVLSADFMQQYE